LLQRTKHQFKVIKGSCQVKKESKPEYKNPDTYQAAASENSSVTTE